MKTIRQYTWENMQGPKTLKLPESATVLNAEVVHGTMLRISVLLDPSAPTVERQFQIYTTEDSILEERTLYHVASVQSHTHVFQVCE